MFNEEKIKAIFLSNYEELCIFDNINEGDGTVLSDDQCFDIAKERMIKTLESDDQDELLEITRESDPKKFEEAKTKAIKFIENL